MDVRPKINLLKQVGSEADREQLRTVPPFDYVLKGPTKASLKIVTRSLASGLSGEGGGPGSFLGFADVLDRVKDFSTHEMGGIVHILSDTPLLDLMFPPLLHRELRTLGVKSTSSSLTFAEDGSQVQPEALDVELYDLWNRSGSRRGTSGAAGESVVRGTPGPLVWVVADLNSGLHSALSKAAEKQAALRKRVSLVTNLGGELVEEKQNLLLLMVWPLWLLERFELTIQDMKLPMSLGLTIRSSVIDDWLEQLLTSYDNSWKSDLVAGQSETDRRDLIRVDDQESSLTPSRIAERLDQARKQAGVKRATREDSRLLKAVIGQLGSDDRRIYARARDLRLKLNSLKGKDLAPVLSDLLGEKLQGFEIAYGERLVKEAEAAGLELTGEHPKYTVLDERGSNSFEVEVRVPYGYVFVDGAELQNRNPRGVIDEVKRRLERRGSFREVEISQASFAEMALKVLDLITSLLGSPEVTVDALVGAITGFLEEAMLKPRGSVGGPVKVWVGEQISKEDIWKSIVSRGWRFEAGKIGGVVLEGSGKRAVIMVRGGRNG